EVSVDHLLRGYERREGAWVGTLRSSLIASEEKDFVLDDGAANNTAELVSFQGVAAGRKKVPRIQIAVPQEFEQIPMELVRAGLGDGIDSPAGMKPVLRR